MCACDFAPESTGLADDIDEDGLACLHGVDTAPERGREVVRIGDRADTDMAQGFRELRVVHIRVPDRRADMGSGDVAYNPFTYEFHPAAVFSVESCVTV